MTVTRYAEMRQGRLRRVGCMKCGAVMYDYSDPDSVRAADNAGLPVRVKIQLNSPAITQALLCKECNLTAADLPALEATMKHGWMYEYVQCGRSREKIIALAKNLRELHLQRII